MHAEPPITFEKLVNALKGRGLIDEQTLIAIMGADRHSGDLVRLEKALVGNNVCSDQTLLLLKGAAAGRTVLDDPSIEATTDLPPKLVAGIGVLALARTPQTIVFVDDAPDKVQLVAQAVGHDDFDIWLCTARQFEGLAAAAYKGQKRDNRRTISALPEVFDEVVTAGASDVIMAVGQPPALRVDGELRKLDRQPLTQEWMNEAVGTLATEAMREDLNQDHALDLAYAFGDVRFRISIGRDRHGYTITARMLPSDIPDMEDLGLPRAIQDFTKLERGLVLVTGPTGSGKSTTLASLINYIARTQSRNIITLEDPIEYVLTAGTKSIITQRELGQSFAGFAPALRQALRQDPDIILVGEMRDQETIRTALTAASTGHLVFSTLHTYDAPQTIERIIGMVPEAEKENVRTELAYVLQGVVSQTLLPRAQTAGRIAAFEILLGTDGVQNLIRQPDGLAHIRNEIVTGHQHGMQTLEKSLAELVKTEKVRVSEAEYRARRLDDLRDLMGR